MAEAGYEGQWVCGYFKCGGSYVRRRTMDVLLPQASMWRIGCGG